MARLPTAEDLSGPLAFQSKRVIASYDTSAIGRGLANMGADISAAAKQAQDQQNTVDIARAEAEKTKGLLDVQNKFANDPGYDTYNKRAPVQTGEVVKNAGNLIRDPRMRERWLIGAGTDAVRVNDGINDHGVQVGREAETVAFDNALETNRRIYVDPNTPDAVRAKAKADIEGAIQAGKASGLLDPSQAEARRSLYIDKANFSRAELEAGTNPDAFQRPRGPVGNMIVAKSQEYGVPPGVALGIAQIESGMNPNAKASTSSAGGVFQFVDGTAAQYGLTNKFDAGANVDAGVRLTRDNINTLRKSLGRDPTPGEIYLAHFAGSGAAQDLASAHANTPTSEIFSRDAIAANRSILEGKTAGQVKAWAEKKMADATRQAGGGQNPDYYDTLSPEEKYAVQNKADTTRNQNAAQDKSNIDVAVTNGPAAVLNTGQYTGNMPSQDQFVQAYGPQEGATRYDTFVASMQTSKQAYDMRTMSAGDIQTMVNAAKPTSSGDDAALQTARYQTLSQAAETTLKAREADPATYVRQAFPAVNQQWSNAASQGNYQGAVAASIAAQEQIGIKNVQPLPKDIATNAVSVFKDENQQQASRIGAVSSIIMATNDPVQRGKLFEQMVSEGLPDLTQGAFEALSRGDQGAANRLFQAAMTDPTKLAGQAKDGQKPADIDQAVQATLMDQGQIGDIYYGLLNGTAENYTRAQRDSKLINNAVNLRLRNGETMDAAIAGVSKDLYGDVKVVNDTNMQILVPKDQDVAAVQAGLTAQLPNVEAALKTALAVPADAKVADGSKAIMTATTDNYIKDILSQGYFRNSGNGYVFIDPKTALAVADQNGQAIIFKPDLKPVAPAAALDRNPPANVGIRDAVMGQ